MGPCSSLLSALNLAICTFVVFIKVFKVQKARSHAESYLFDTQGLSPNLDSSALSLLLLSYGLH